MQTSKSLSRLITPAFSDEQIERMNVMIGECLLSPHLAYRLVVQRDPAIANSFGLTTQTWKLLEKIEAQTLKEFCQAVMRYQGKIYD